MRSLKFILVTMYTLCLYESGIVKHEQFTAKNATNGRYSKKLVSRFLRLFNEGKNKLKNIKVNVKSELRKSTLPNKAKNDRKLVMGLSGGQMIGLLGGLGGYYSYNKGKKHGMLEFSRLKQLDRTESFDIMLKTQHRNGLLEQIRGIMRDLESRFDDMTQQSDNKLQQYEVSLLRAIKN